MPHSSTWENIKYRFKSNNLIFRIIIINVIVFVVIGLLNVIYSLFEIPKDSFNAIWNFLSLSADPKEVLYKPWTLFTYMFMHAGIFHILFNMLWLYWIGKIFLEYLNTKQFTSVYYLSGLLGGLIYLIAYQVFPALVENQPANGLVGASAGVIGIIIATATLLPNITIYLMFLGPVKLKYIAIVSLILFVLGLGGTNAGGNFAHLGGALFGFLWFNVYPAELFMGDTGSLALGATLGVVALMTGQWAVLPIIAIIPVSVTVSSMLQVGYFKLTRRVFGEGRRLFKMAPLHHHFELSGWSETQVVQRFWLVSLLAAMIGVALAVTY